MIDSDKGIKVLLFSYLKEKLGVAELEIDASQVETVSDVMILLEKSQVAHGDHIAKMRPFIRFALNQKYCNDDHAVKSGDVLALITPVSGG